MTNNDGNGNYFLCGMKDYDLKLLFKAVRSELKQRGLIRYNPETLNIELIQNRATPIPTKRLRKNKGLVISGRNGSGCNIKMLKINKGCANSILIDFLREDWSFLFTEYENKDNNFYVYYHTDPTKESMAFNKDGMSVNFNGKPFYVGKGVGNRYKSIKHRNTSHINKVKSILSSGIPPEKVFNIIQSGLTESEALELESKFITFFGTMGEYNPDKQYFTHFNGGILINSDVGKRPVWITNMINDIHNRNKI